MKKLSKVFQFLKQSVIVRSSLIIIGLLFLSSVFIDANTANATFIFLFFAFSIIFVNANNFYQLNNKMLFYLTSMGQTRKRIIQNEVIKSLFNLLYLFVGIILYSFFVWLYSGTRVLLYFNYFTYIEIILLFILYLLFSFLVGYLNLKYYYYFIIKVSIVLMYISYLFLLKLKYFYLSILISLINLFLIFINRKFIKKDIKPIEF